MIVDDEGAALGPPYQITFDGPDIYNQQPSWSNNSKSLVFHSNRTSDNFDFDIWSVNIASGELETGIHNVEWNPASQAKGLTSGIYLIQIISAEGIQTKQMMYTLDK